MHLIYAVLSIMLVGLFSMSMSRSIHHAEGKMVLNEVLTELTGVGYDVLEFVGRQPFDEHTDESKVSPLVYPIITSTGQLTSAVDFGGCTALTLSNPSCDDVDDFDGVSVTVLVQDLEYTMTVEVRYVDPLDPTIASAARTYAKEVAVTVTNPYLLVGGQPLEVTLSRVFTYNRHTV